MTAGELVNLILTGVTVVEERNTLVIDFWGILTLVAVQTKGRLRKSVSTVVATANPIFVIEI
jgi:hypothetical protein